MAGLAQPQRWAISPTVAPVAGSAAGSCRCAAPAGPGASSPWGWCRSGSGRRTAAPGPSRLPPRRPRARCGAGETRRCAGSGRPGSYGKTVTTTAGPVRIAVPRDRDSSFEPKIVPKGRRRGIRVNAHSSRPRPAASCKIPTRSPGSARTRRSDARRGPMSSTGRCCSWPAAPPAMSPGGPSWWTAAGPAASSVVKGGRGRESGQRRYSPGSGCKQPGPPLPRRTPAPGSAHCPSRLRKAYLGGRGVRGRRLRLHLASAPRTGHGKDPSNHRFQFSSIFHAGALLGRQRMMKARLKVCN